MALNTRLIKRRIKSVKNTKKITKAMELVAASKMRRTVSTAVRSRSYASYSWELLQQLKSSVDDVHHPLLAVRPVRKILLVVVTSNRGLAGGFTSNVMRKVVEQVKNPMQIARNRIRGKWIEPTEESSMDFVVVGKKGERAVRAITDKIIASFVEINDVPKFSDALPIIRLVTEMYERAEYDKVVLVYTDYVSALIQRPRIRQVLPVSEVDIEKMLFADNGEAMSSVDSFAEEKDAVLFEPNKNDVLKFAVTRLIEAQVYQAILESSASEHSARMVAMRSATESATEMIDDLTLVFNQARQAGITREISEISAGKAALE